MTSDQRLTLILATMGIIFIPLLGLLVRITIKWTRVEDALKQLVADKDRVHREIIDQMREDRDATNKRLTWLEQNLWQRGRPRL